MTLHKFAFTLLAAFTTCSIAEAYDISGTVVDSAGEPLPQASVRVLRPDSAYVKGSASNADGKFLIQGISNGRYIVESTYVGFDRACKNVEVKNADISGVNIAMTENSIMLKETVVTGIKTPIRVAEDTIEFNADSYKTQPNAVVEDLLKRLPGVEVGTDGSITANGKTVSKILVDGKEFFSDDPKVASKNLPVNMVDKLQVVDRKSDLARLTGVDDGEDETVINLTVKKGMQNGWFGNAQVGYGTDDRYKGNFMVNRFMNGNQLTILGNLNNINELGFTDGNGERFRRFGGDNGITTSQSVGVNFNIGNEEIFRVGGNVLYSHTDRHTVTRQNREYLLENNPYTQNSVSDARDKGNNVRGDFRLEWKPDSLNVFDFRPNFSYNQNNSFSDALSVASGKNLSLNRGDSDGKSYEFGGRIIYTHNFKSRKGRSISFSGNYKFSNVRENEDSYAYNVFYNFNDSLDVYDQLLDNHTWSNTVNGRLTWTEPIGNPANGNFLTLAYSVNYKWNNADKMVYDRSVLFGDDYWSYDLQGQRYDLPVPIVDMVNPVLNDTLSNSFRNTNFRQDIRLGYRKVTSKLNLNVGVSIVPISSQSTNLINSAKSIPVRNSFNFAPFVRLRYKFSKNSSLQVFYNGRPSEPSMSQLQPVADYSNPMNIKIGNPELLTTFNHNLRVRQQLFDPDAQRSIMTMLMATVSQNSIISKTVYDEMTGGRVTTYENVNGTWNARLMNMFSQPLRNKAFTFNNNIMLYYNHQIGYNNSVRNLSNTFNLHESLSFAYRPDYLEFELRPSYSLSTVSNSASTTSNSTTHRFGGTFYATYSAPFGLVLSSDLSYTATRGFAAGYNENTWMWNASVSYQFLRDRNAIIQLSAYDLLQQKKNINRTITASYIDNTSYNSLTRYFMVSFTYKFNTFGKGNEPSLRNDRPGPGGGPGGGPHGPMPPRH